MPRQLRGLYATVAYVPKVSSGGGLASTYHIPHFIAFITAHACLDDDDSYCVYSACIFTMKILSLVNGWQSYLAQPLLAPADHWTNDPYKK